MGTLNVQVKPVNPGTVTVKVWLAQSPGGTPINETLEATSASPVNKTWTLDPALYAVTISWQSGFHNIASGVAGNAIVINGNNSLYYQVLGTPADANGVSANFGARVT